MSFRGWASTLGYFLIGCGILLLAGLLVSSMTSETKVRVGVSRAAAQTPADPPPPAPAPAPAPGPEAIAEPPIEPPPAPVAEALPGPEMDLPPGPDESPVEVPEKRELGVLDGIIVDFYYKGEGKRDPFATLSTGPVVVETGPPMGPVTELERFDLDQLRLVGIIWGVPKPKALLIDPQSRTHVVFKKSRVGRNNGYVAEIREGEIVVIESFNNEGRVSYNPRLIRLQRE